MSLLPSPESGTAVDCAVRIGELSVHRVRFGEVVLARLALGDQRPELVEGLVAVTVVLGVGVRATNTPSPTSNAMPPISAWRRIIGTPNHPHMPSR